MTTATIRAGSGPRSIRTDSGGRPWGWWAAALAAVLSLALVGAWLLGWISFGTDPRVAEIQQMQEEARRQFADVGGPRTIAEATAAVTAMNTIRAKVEALPPHLKPQVEQQGRNVFRSAMRARIDAYFAAPVASRQAELDRQIDQEEMIRKAFEAGQAVANMVGGGQQGSQQQGSQQQAGQGSQRGGGPPQGGSEEDRNRWRKSIIDSTTPEQRARYVEYRRAMEERREQRGMTSGWGR
ncbi:MAG: hypothetical protein ACKO4Z_15110 [Planctomycetota bacterium]